MSFSIVAGGEKLPPVKASLSMEKERGEALRKKNFSFRQNTAKGRQKRRSLQQAERDNPYCHSVEKIEK